MQLKVWDPKTGRPLATLEGHAGWVTACAVTLDSRRVVSASDDSTLKVRHLETGRSLATRVVSASADKTLKVWHLETCTCLVTHRGDTPYAAVATSATAIVAGDITGGLWILDWPPSVTRHRG